MLGYDVGVFPETVFTWENIIHPEDYPGVMSHFDDYIKGRIDFYEAEYRARKADGSYLWIQDQGKIVERNPDGSVARMIGAHLDINEQKLSQIALEHQNELLNENKFTLENLIEKRTVQLEEANRKLVENLKKINELSIKDSLTSLYNRRKLEQDLHREIDRVSRYKTPLSIALFDIDHFKTINDINGHHAGDEILRLVSKLILDHIRETDILGRWGGDEFFLILPGIHKNEALIIIEKIRILIASSGFTKSITVTCSFGVTEYIQGDSVESMYKRADIGLYQAKNAGRNTAVAH
jgi:diguanylate cyclase (GGDEF)-like protein